MREFEKFPLPVDKAPAFAVRSFYKDDFGCKIKGDVFMTLRDGKTGEIQEHRELKNLIVMDASVMVARLLKDPSEPWHGIYALALGTGSGAWDPMHPPAATVTRRSLYSEICRKTFTSMQFIDGSGVPTTTPTNTVDYTCTVAESESVGPLCEMALLAGMVSNNMSIRNPIMPPDGFYNPAIDQTHYESIINALNFAVINKPATSTFTIVWRITT